MQLNAKKIIFAIFLIMALSVLFFGLSQDIRNSKKGGDRQAKEQGEPGQNQEVSRHTEEINSILGGFQGIKGSDARQKKIGMALYEAGFEKESVSFCEYIESKKVRSNCYLHTAVKKRDITMCNTSAMDGEQQGICERQTIMARAREEGDIGSCGLLESLELKQACLKRGVKASTDMDVCSPVEDSELSAYCESLVYSNLAQEKGDKEICGRIADRKLSIICQADVLGVIVSSDHDKDGLSFYQEMVYGTDPENPDTDGDGFSDGEEIQEGYNPVGHDPSGYPTAVSGPQQPE